MTLPGTEASSKCEECSAHPGVRSGCVSGVIVVGWCVGSAVLAICEPPHCTKDRWRRASSSPDHVPGQATPVACQLGPSQVAELANNHDGVSY